MGAQQAARYFDGETATEPATASLPEDERRGSWIPYEPSMSVRAVPISFGSALDDGIIDPVDTRNILGLCLDVAMTPIRPSHFLFSVRFQ